MRTQPLIALFLLALASSLFAQQQSTAKPEDTEVWQPEPKVVTPGATSPKLPEQVGTDMFLACFGDNVQAGQLLAEISTPEVDQQLAQARAQEEIAKVTADRWRDLLDKKVVSKQRQENR